MKKNYPTKNNFTSYFYAIIKSNALFKNAALLLFIAFGFTSVSGQVTTDSFTSTGAATWTTPCGVTSITVEAWGAGGAGGGTGVNNAKGGGGGAGGTYVSSTFTVVSGTTYNLFIAPITNGAASAGLQGQGSWFNTNTILFAQGGNGGAAPNGGTVAGGLGSTTSSIGTTITVGTNGANGTNTIGGAGGTGANSGGAGGTQTTTSGGNGNTGTGPGGGGGGSFVNGTGKRNGGNGARGEVRITYTSVLPANPANPTSNSPQCNPPGVTLTRGTPSDDVTWYWQTTALGTSTANSSATYVVNTSGTFYVRSQSDLNGCWSAGSGYSTIIITPALTAIAGTPNPTNSATGVCYAGTGAVSTISWSAVTGASSYDVYFGAGSLPGSATSTVASTTYNTGALLASTTYYWKIVPKNPCGVTSGSPTTWSFTTSPAPCYCIPTGSLNCGVDDYISNVTLSTLNNSTTCSPGGYTVYPASGAQTTTLVTGQTYTFNLNVGPGSGTHGAAVWIDFNQNGVFTDAGEYFLISNAIAPNGSASITIPIPAGASAGQVQMRVRYGYSVTVTSAMSCTMPGTFGETEDYTISLIIPVPCTAPTTQPNSLILTPSGTTINGAFAAAVSGAQSYLVIANTTGSAPTVVNGTTYTIGSTILGGTNVVIDTDTNTTFSATSLAALTTYYFFVYSMNNLCTGGPLYLNSSPLTGNATTSSCVPTVTNTYQEYNYINQVSFLGNLTNPPVNNSTYSSSPLGYQDFTSLTKATQAQGEGVNIFMNTTNGTNFMKAWVDWNKNGDFEVSEIVYQCTNAFVNTTFGFQIPIATVPGDYKVRMRIISAYNGTNIFDSCTSYTNVDGETEDYSFTVVANCSAKIISIANGFKCGTGAVTLNAVGSSGTTEYRWYSTATGGTYTSSPTSSWNTPSISTTTTYYVTAYNGTCESLYRTAVVATIKKVPSLTFSNSDPEICGENNIIDLTATGSNEQIFLVDENFEGASISFINTQITSPNGAITNWQVKSSTYVPAYPTYPVWYPAISSGFGSNKFIMSTSDLTAGGTTAGKVNEALELRTAVNTTGFINLTMTFKIYFSSYNDINNATVEGVFVETNSGSGWTILTSYLGDEGIGTNFVNKSINLNAFTNINSLKVRIRYRAGWCDGVAVDDIKLFGDRPLLPNFTWTSGFPIDAYTNLLCTPPYAYTTGTPASTVFVKPTLTQLENGSFSFTANANLTNGCTTSGTINVTNKSKVWKGINGNWNDAANWMPVGIPNATNCVIISTAPNNCLVGSTNFNGYGKTLQVIDTGKLTINPTNSLTITDFVEVRGTTTAFTIEDSGSLLQINDAIVNKGNIFYKRIAPSIKGSDYIYWSSPVENQNMGTFYDPTFPYASGIKYQWNTTLNNGNGTGGNIGQGLWEAASGIMTRARGYIIRGSSSYGMPSSAIPTIFNGVPFNGAIQYTVQRGAYTGLPYNGANTIQITNLNDNYNLLGNPYPSSINALKFLRLNTYDPSINPTGVLLGNVKLWRHGIDPMQGVVNPFYGSYQINYDVNDYLTVNYTGATVPGPVDIIKSGQAFFVQMIDGPAGSGIVKFNNSMRFDDLNLPYKNDLFYKHGTVRTDETPFERNRIWLALTDTNNKSSGMCVGYATDATNNYDNLFDAPTGIPSGLKIFSMIENNIDIYEIQGRTLPFDINDEIPIGIVAPTQGNYTFALAGVDGLFDNQNIYVKDNFLNSIHNLKTNPYTFTTVAGVNKDRFTIVYVDSTLGNPDYLVDNTIKVLTNNEVSVSSSTLQMESIVVYTILGQELNSYKNISSNYVILSNLHKNNTTLLLKIKLQTGETVTKKIIF